ncbi:MAG: hypothetical protein NTV98_03425 [Candidatus Roizmanbacteria bacterium]|nr:hypothetical protein [Candidatus Roizmanbacteria bacterium]
MQTNFARRLVSLVSSLSILLQSFLPFTYINPSTIFAQDTLTNVISYNKDKGVFHFELNNKDMAITTGQVSYALSYKNKTSGQIENANGTTVLSDTNFSRDIDAATCSTGGVCVRHEVKQGIMKVSTPNWFDSQWFKIENGSLVVKSQYSTGSVSNLSANEEQWLNSGEVTPTTSPTPTVEPSVQPTIEPTVAPTGQTPISHSHSNHNSIIKR